MKKQILIAAAVGTALIFTACGGGSSSSTTAAPAAQTTAAQTAAAETKAEETTAAETTAAETTAAETAAASETEKDVDLEALLEDDGKGDLIPEEDDNAFMGYWWDEDPESDACIEFRVNGEISLIMGGEETLGTYKVTGDNAAEGKLGDKDIKFTMEEGFTVISVDDGEKVMTFSNAGDGLEMQALSPVVDYWYPDGDTTQGYILFNADDTMEVLNSEGTQEGTYVYEDGSVTATVGDETVTFRLTEDDTLVPEPDDGSFRLVRGSACSGLTAGDDGKKGMGSERDVSFVTEDATHTRVRDYDNEVGIIYPDELDYFDYFGDALIVGTESGSYLVARNVTFSWETYAGEDVDFLAEYADTCIRDDFGFLYGDIENEMDVDVREADGTGDRRADFAANFWNADNDILVKSALFKRTYKKDGEVAYIVKTVYVPYAEDSMMDYLWDETKVIGVKNR